MRIINGMFGSHRFLSNFHYEPVTYEGMVYVATENAYQAAKTTNLKVRARFQDVEPKEAKNMGSKKAGIIMPREGWDDMRVDVMRELQREKFKFGSELSQRLVDTGSAVIVENNWWKDRYWGCCEDDGGENWMGILVMERREELRQRADALYQPLPLEEIQRLSKEAVIKVTRDPNETY